MGVRSDVAVCLKTSLNKMLPMKFRASLFTEAEEHEAEEGVCYVFKDIKWYFDLDTEIMEFYSWLHENNSADYKVVIACHDYPSSDDGADGSWNDNPWDAHREVSVSLVVEVR